MTINEALVVVFPDVSIKLGLGYSLFTNALLSLGTERHEEIYKVAWAGQVKIIINLSNIKLNAICFIIFNKKKVRCFVFYSNSGLM